MIPLLQASLPRMTQPLIVTIALLYFAIVAVIATWATRKTKTERDAHQRGECALRDHKTLSKYLRQTKTGRLVLDRQKLVAEEHRLIDEARALMAARDHAAQAGGGDVA